MIKISGIAGALLLSHTARAVVVLSGDANSTAPSGQAYFGNIGTVGGASGVYLGNRWVLTAAHVAGTLPAQAVFGGTAYATEAGSFHRIENPAGSGLSTFTDVVVFRLAADPGLPWLEIGTSTPTVGADVMMIGRGRQQAAAATYWQVTPVAGSNNDIWTEVPEGSPDIDASGFKTDAVQIVRWGENQVAATGLEVNYGAGDVLGFTTNFDEGAAVHEAQAVLGDSGGAVLISGGAGWRIAGMMAAVATYDNQPANTAVLGNQTLAVDLTAYRDSINSITGVPEPGPLACLLAAAGCVVRRKR